MNTVRINEERLDKLAHQIRDIKRKLPNTRTFPLRLKREAIHLLHSGISARRIAKKCGLCSQTIINWRNKLQANGDLKTSETASIPKPRELLVIPEKNMHSDSRAENISLPCEIDIGHMIKIRIPLNALNSELLRTIKEVF